MHVRSLAAGQRRSRRNPRHLSIRNRQRAARRTISACGHRHGYHRDAQLDRRHDWRRPDDIRDRSGLGADAVESCQRRDRQHGHRGVIRRRAARRLLRARSRPQCDRHQCAVERNSTHGRLRGSGCSDSPRVHSCGESSDVHVDGAGRAIARGIYVRRRQCARVWKIFSSSIKGLQPASPPQDRPAPTSCASRAAMRAA